MKKSKVSLEMRILLDTPFLLPIVGVRIREVEKLLEELWTRFRRGEVEVYYTELNLLEVAWKLSKTYYEPAIVVKGLMSIEKYFTKAPVTWTSIAKALELRKKGFRDLVDLLLYAVAYENKLHFLTLDSELVRFLGSIGEDTSIIVTTL